MSRTVLEDIKTDRVTFDLPLFEVEPDRVQKLKVVDIGCPEVEDNRMCAQCIGECKVH